MEEAISHLEGALRFTLQECPSHRAALIDGWNDCQETRCSIAHYLVGLRACAMDAALRINAILEDNEEDQVEILENVIAVVGNDNNISDDQKQHERNPWIAEGIWHMCMAIAARRNELHPCGHIIALDYAHVITKDHGLDVAAIYEHDDIVGLSLVETKTYRDRPDKALYDAVVLFREVDEGKHSARIRQTVQTMRSALLPEQQSKISTSFWKRNRTYIPNPHYLSLQDKPIDWTRRRPSLRNLLPDRLNILIMPHLITEFDSFFDRISDEMREFARGLQNV
jgi:hypothetical protein